MVEIQRADDAPSGRGERAGESCDGSEVAGSNVLLLSPALLVA